MSCLDDALETGDQWAVRGGLTPRQRRTIRSNRNRGDAA